MGKATRFAHCPKERAGPGEARQLKSPRDHSYSSGRRLAHRRASLPGRGAGRGDSVELWRAHGWAHSSVVRLLHKFDRLGGAGASWASDCRSRPAQGCAACEAAQCRDSTVELAETGVFCTAQRPRGRGVSALMFFSSVLGLAASHHGRRTINDDDIAERCQSPGSKEAGRTSSRNHVVSTLSNRGASARSP